MTIKTTRGPITLERPKLRGANAAFASRLLGKGVTRPHALEALVIAGYVRGLSTRDVEASLAEALGPEAALSRSTVSRVCEAIQGEFAAWRTRSLVGLDPLYVFVDGSHFRDHDGARPSRCCAPGRSPPTASRSWLAWMAPTPSPPTPAWGSCATWSPVGWMRHCW